ncbi:MAG: Thioredoxin [Alphaproteobacteria bacterium MarineAlpha6_Bin4]|nr:MAG: Thioredoxin [Alphaproteobacteria bacterium MarineAlpha6_Bin5]PPR37727.1 MAG: Thioredoxin [Alphaproteobacteria bacterium MarineAlpha6_Bin4]|tara:strand:- start:9258 stop:9578 length:321 start_codon:yes stop_codon:yes gene_type:complete
MSIKAIKEDVFDNEVLNSEIPVLIDFWAEWCGPCKEISPILEEISNEIGGKIKILKLNIDENPNIPNKYAVQSIPTLIIFKNGEPVATKIGSAVKSELLKWIETSI